jgi:hypothetical protein
MGQAVGTAAALGLSRHVRADEVPIDVLQARLVADGVFLG